MSLKPADHEWTIEWISDTETSRPLVYHFYLFYLLWLNKIGGPLADHPVIRGFFISLKPADHERTIELISDTETDYRSDRIVNPQLSSSPSFRNTFF